MFDKRLMKMCPESKRYIAGNILLQWLELGMNALMIGLIALTVEDLWRQRLTVTAVIWRITVILGTTLVRWMTAKGATRMSYLASRTVKGVMRAEIYRKLLRLGTAYREHVSTAELVQESVEGVEQLESYFGQYVPQFFYALLAPVTLFFLFGAPGSWFVAAVLLICVPLIPGAIMMVQKIAKRLLGKYWDQYARLGSTFLENLQGMTTLKTYQADAWKQDQMHRESEHFREVTMKVLTMQLNSIIIMDFVAYGGAALGIGLACTALAAGRLGLASCVFMILLSADFFLPMRRLGSYFHVAMNGMAASDRIFRFLSEPEPAEKAEVLPDTVGDIRFQSLDFSYTPERKVLHGVSLEIPSNCFIGIVGESGSGKTTLAALLMGRITPQAGQILIGEKNLGNISEESLLRTVTYVGPDSVFFKGSLRENLLLAAPAASEEDLWHALTVCHIDGFFRGQRGLDTHLQENAGNLSGGQKQRLSLARALLHDSPVYIFDEATSNIDMESEAQILAVIQGLTKAKTVLMITHRLSNVTGADRIYCMDRGRVAGSGTHEALLASCGVYQALWNTQRELEDFGTEVSQE